MRPHTRTHCSRKGECEGETRCVGRGPGHRQLELTQLPAELLIKILEYMTFKENSTVRLVCRRLNELCAARVNSTFSRLQNSMLIRFQTIKDGFHVLAGVDKQAMVEDWLNPELGDEEEEEEEEGGHGPAPAVQHVEEGESHTTLRMAKTDEYLRSGPGSPGYTRHGPRSPGGGPAIQPEAGCSGTRTGKRKSKDGSGPSLTLCPGGKVVTRCKRPKLAATATN